MHNELEAVVRTIAETILGIGRRARADQGPSGSKTEIVQRHARIKFVDFPAARADDMCATDAVTLERWMDALVVADTLDEVFDPRGRD